MKYFISFILLLFLLGQTAFARTVDEPSDTCKFTCSWYRPVSPEAQAWIDSTGILIDPRTYLACDSIDCHMSVTPQCEVSDFCLTVYSRWGEILFESSVPEISWYAFGQEEGVYIWQVQGVYATGQTFMRRGHVTILY